MKTETEKRRVTAEMIFTAEGDHENLGHDGELHNMQQRLSSEFTDLIGTIARDENAEDHNWNWVANICEVRLQITVLYD